MEEHQTLNLKVEGSIPSSGSTGSNYGKNRRASMCSTGELNGAWSDKPPRGLLPGYYQVAHVKSRDTWITEIRRNDSGNTPYLWIPLPGGGAKHESKFHTLPWLWGPRLDLIKVPAKPFGNRSQVSG